MPRVLRPKSLWNSRQNPDTLVLVPGGGVILARCQTPDHRQREQEQQGRAGGQHVQVQATRHAHARRGQRPAAVVSLGLVPPIRENRARAPES